MGVLRDRTKVPGGAAFLTRAGRLVAGTRDEVPGLRRVLASPRLLLGQVGRTGPAAADQISLPIPSSRPCRAAPCGPSGSRATPIRQPPSARFLLSPVVTTVRSGAKSTGLATAGEEP